ncbi:hypothetical protein BJ878DRAFT_485880, partial [Calycina marina]
MLVKYDIPQTQTLDMPTSMLPVQKEPERGLALQKYLLLHSQHDALQKHLSKISPAVQILGPYPDSVRHASLSSSPESDGGYLSSSPPEVVRHHCCAGNNLPCQRPVIKKRRSSLPATIDDSLICEMQEDEQKLKNVNQQIKTTLTELLNCQSVRTDDQYRKWVQTKLMDTELELKGTRSRSCGRRRASEDMGGF